MTSANPMGLFKQRDVSETASQKFPCGGQACNAGSDDANFVVGLGSAGNTELLLNQFAVVKT